MIKNKGYPLKPSLSPTKNKTSKKKVCKTGIKTKKKQHPKDMQNQIAADKTRLQKKPCKRQDSINQQHQKRVQDFNDNSIIKKQQQLKRMVWRLQKQVDYLLSQQSPRKMPKKYVSSKLNLPIKSKAGKKTNRQTLQFRDQNIKSTLSGTKSFRSLVQTQTGTQLGMQRNKKVLSINNQYNVKDFLFLDGKFIRTNKSLIESMKKTLHSRKNTQVLQNRAQTFLVHQQSDTHQGVLDSERKLKAIQRYQTKKAIVIQKWWRKCISKKKLIKIEQNNKDKNSILERIRKQLNKQIKHQKSDENSRYQCFLEFCPEIRSNNTFNNDAYQTEQQCPDSNKKTLSTIPATAKQIVVNSSDQESETNLLECNHSQKLEEQAQEKEFIDSIQCRQNAAKIRRDTHIAILRQIKSKKNMDDTLFGRYVEMVQQNYNKELEQINQIRTLLDNNAAKVEQIISGVKQSVQNMENSAHEAIQNQEIIDRIFKKSIHGENPTHRIIENPVRRFPFLTQISYEGNNQSSQLESNFIAFKKRIPYKKCKLLDLQRQKEQQNKSQQSSVVQSYQQSNSQHKVPEFEFEKKSVYAFPKFDTKDEAECESPINQRAIEYFTSFSSFQQQQDSLDADQETNAQDYQNRNQFDFTSGQCYANNNNEIAIYLDQTKVQNQINQRVAEQLSMAPKTQFAQVDTSLMKISKVLVEFFEYYLHQHKQQFLHFINTPFGENPRLRLARMQNYQEIYQESNQDACIYGIVDVVSKIYYEQYQKRKLFEEKAQVTRDDYKDCDWKQFEDEDHFDKKLVKQSQFFHNMAIYDAMNQAFDEIRPYFQTSGESYDWNISDKSLSFYFITEDAIHSVFYKAQMRIIKWASSLCGLIIDTNVQANPKPEVGLICLNNDYEFDQDNQCCHSNAAQKSFENTLNCYKNCTNKVLSLFHEEKLKNVEIMEIKEENCRIWTNWNEQRTMIMYGLGMLVFDELLRQFGNQFNER